MTDPIKALNNLMQKPPLGISITVRPSLICPGASIATVNKTQSEVTFDMTEMAMWVLKEVEKQRLDKPAPRRKVIAVDFDGTLCENEWPNIGAPKWDVIAKAWARQRQGAELILWTCRENELLEDAIVWCIEHDLYFDGVNENTPERAALYGDARKIGADEYWDDRAIQIL